MAVKRKSTIRKMRGYPVSRELWHLLAELASVERRLAAHAEKVEATEAEARAERARHAKRGAK